MPDRNTHKKAVHSESDFSDYMLHNLQTSGQDFTNKTVGDREKAAGIREQRSTGTEKEERKGCHRMLHLSTEASPNAGWNSRGMHELQSEGEMLS